MKNWQGENKVELTDKDHLELAIKNLAKDGFFAVEDFIDSNLCESISKKVIKFIIFR